jgi:hypothetical protein
MGAAKGRICRAASRATAWLLTGAMIAALLWTVHLFARHIDHSPYLAVDDALANVSVSLAERGQYGFPASPIEGGLEGGMWLRLHQMLNYGPAAFIVGAALEWLFGASYAVLRWIHPLCMAGVAALAVQTLRARSLAAAGGFVITLLYLFCATQWPMFRPDPFVAFAAAAAVAGLTHFLRSGSTLSATITGFMATLAATTHQIAWTVPVSTGLVWLATLSWRSRADNARSFCAFGVGALAALLIFLGAIGFQISRLVALWHWYASFTGRIAGSVSPLEILGTHLNHAWAGVSAPVISMLIAACLLGLALFVRALIRQDRNALATLVPPLVLGSAYQLSLALYPNFHSGYTLFVQVSTLWFAAAGIAEAVASLGASPLRREWVEAGLRAAVAAAAIWPGLPALRADNWKVVQAPGYVGIASYIDRVMGGVPEQSRIWGDPYFGIESGTRYQLVDLEMAAGMSKLLTGTERRFLRPDFLILNRSADNFLFLTFEHLTELMEHSGTGPDRDPGIAFAGLHDYHVDAIVSAPPYGATQIFARGPDSGAPPRLDDYDPVTRSWMHGIGTAVEAPIRGVEPISLTLSKAGIVKTLAADRTLRTDLPAGTYLVEFAFPGGPSPARGAIAATFKADVGLLRLLDFGFQIPIAVYFPGASRAYMLLHHRGGAVYFSQFDLQRIGNFSVAGIRPITGPPLGGDGTPMPPLDAWRVAAAGGEAAKIDGGLEVTGDRSKFGYQLVSPSIPGRPGHVYKARLPVSTDSGLVGVGVLNKAGEKWLVAPSQSEDLRFTADGTGEVEIVIANDNTQPPDHPSRFTVRPGSLTEMGREGATYADELAKCYVPPEERDPHDCLEAGGHAN